MSKSSIIESKIAINNQMSLYGKFLIMPCPKGDQRFLMSEKLGPLPLKMNGTESRRALGQFYPLYDIWVMGGKLVDGNRCVVMP